MTKNLTNQDRRLVREHLDSFLMANKLNPAIKLDRVRLWCEGYSMREIAAKEDVSLATVQKTIQPVVTEVINYVKNQD